MKNICAPKYRGVVDAEHVSHHLQLREELALASEVVLDTVTRTSADTEPRVRARVTRCKHFGFSI